MVNEWDKSDVEQYSQYDSSELDIIHPELLRMLGDLAGKKVADYGCGEGKFLDELWCHKAQVYGYDISGAMIDKSRERMGNKAVLEVIESGKLPLPDRSIDAVVSNLVLMMCPTKEMIEQVHREVNRVLAEKGLWVYCITHPAFIDHDFTTYRNIFRNGLDYQRIGQPHQFVLRRKDGEEITNSSFIDYHYPLSTYMNLLHETGFRMEEFNEVSMDRDSLPPYLIIKGVKD